MRTDSAISQECLWTMCSYWSRAERRGRVPRLRQRQLQLYRRVQQPRLRQLQLCPRLCRRGQRRRRGRVPHRRRARFLRSEGSRTAVDKWVVNYTTASLIAVAFLCCAAASAPQPASHSRFTVRMSRQSRRTSLDSQKRSFTSACRCQRNSSPNAVRCVRLARTGCAYDSKL